MELLTHHSFRKGQIGVQGLGWVEQVFPSSCPGNMSHLLRQKRFLPFSSWSESQSANSIISSSTCHVEYLLNV